LYPSTPTPLHDDNGASVDHNEDENEDNDDTEDKGWTDGFELEDVEKDDIVVLYCEDPRDKCALRVASIDKLVWIARIIKISVLKKRSSSGLKLASITATFYRNTEKDFTKPVKPSVTTQMKITETSLLHVFKEDSFDVVSLDDSQIQEVTEFIRLHCSP
jgi:hypothetical protein